MAQQKPTTPSLMWGWLETKISLWAVLGAVGLLALWALQVDARAREAERVNVQQDKRLEAMESAVKNMILQTYQQEQMTKQLAEMSRQLEEFRRVPAAIEVLSFRMGNVEMAVGATPRRPQK